MTTLGYHLKYCIVVIFYLLHEIFNKYIIIIIIITIEAISSETYFVPSLTQLGYKY